MTNDLTAIRAQCSDGEYLDAYPGEACDTIIALCDETERLRAEIARLREALTFYTVPGNWLIGGPLDGNSGNYTGGPARAALGQEGDA